MNRFTMLMAVTLAPIVLIGCSGDVEVGKVNGVVTLDGKPLRGIVVVFQPMNHAPSYAITDAEGRYTLDYKAGISGAIVGKQDVFLDQLAADEMGDLPPGVDKPSQFPDKYRDVFETVEVSSGRNEFNFELTSN